MHFKAPYRCPLKIYGLQMTLKALKPNQIGYESCTEPRCKTCNMMPNPSSFIRKKTKWSYPTTGCSTMLLVTVYANVIYQLSCESCPKDILDKQLLDRML